MIQKGYRKTAKMNDISSRKTQATYRIQFILFGTTTPQGGNKRPFSSHCSTSTSGTRPLLSTNNGHVRFTDDLAHTRRPRGIVDLVGGECNVM